MHSVPSFEQLFGRHAAVRTSAPGRVNLIGEHTDYNGGFVLPAAIPQQTVVEAAARTDRHVRLWSAQYPDEAPRTFVLGRETRAGGWIDYLQGLTALLPKGAIHGFDARIASDIPVGSGLSSSAALQIAVGRALTAMFALPLDDIALARLAQRAEVEFTGAPVGIMDQMACSLADAATALFLDTRTLASERIPLPPGGALIVIDSGVAHDHAAGDYRVRREECADAARRLGVAELRDAVDGPAAAALPAPLDRRVRHVLTENARVLETVAALRAGDHARIGALFATSHASMRDDFEVSIGAIDQLVEIAAATPGVHGARLTGGGFGGSIVAWADAAAASRAADAIVAEYNRRGGRGRRLLPAPVVHSSR